MEGLLRIRVWRNRAHFCKELFRRHLLPCVNVTGNSSWNNVSVFRMSFLTAILYEREAGANFLTALTGPNAPSPPTAAENASSNCHPTLPKTNDMSQVFAFNETGTVYTNSSFRMLNGVNLILTAFFSPDGTVQSALEEPDVHLSCLEANPLTSSGLESISPSAGTGLRVSRIWGGLVLGLCLWP
jgi:hypothetical protein